MKAVARKEAKQPQAEYNGNITINGMNQLSR